MIHVIDLHDRAPRVIAAFLKETSLGPVLFETGPESRFEYLEQGLAALGYRASDIRHVFVTHIHLDHAGAAWRFAEMGATIYVHPKGAPHLIDPSKLWASATRIYGERMQELWGHTGVVPEAQIVTLGDGDVVGIGNVEIKAIDTPGHASHHLCFQIGSELICGDVAGVRIGKGPVLPPCPPPDIQVEVWLESIAKIRAIQPRCLYLTHFGAFEGVPEHLEALEESLLIWANEIKHKLREGKTRDQIVEAFAPYVEAQLRRAGMGEPELREYDYADPAWMTVDGLIRYWNKYHPDQLQP